MKSIIVIDQGTTGTAVSLYSLEGKKIATADHDFRQIFPRPGWVEHDPDDIWKSVLQGLQQLSQQHDLTKIQTIGITNQRETVMVWDKKTGAPIGHAIVWQCRRTQDRMEKLKQQKLELWVQQKTGLVLDPYFSASKIQWILDSQSRTRTRDLAVGTVDSFLLWKLTGEHRTDVTNASRTMLMDLRKLQWDSDLLKLFKVPEHFMPQIFSSANSFGKTKNVYPLPDGIPVTGIIGDQQSALFGQGAHKAGDSKCTFGTGSFILLNTGRKIVRSKQRLLTTLAWQLQNEPAQYALEGGAFVCGAAVQWLRDGLGLFSSSAEVEGLARSVDDTGGVIFVPALAGMGAPHWKASARGQIFGLTRGTNKAHIARAALEAMSLQNIDILFAMEKDSGQKIRKLRVDGGACANNLLMQMQADFINRNVERPNDLESTSRGAYLIAGLGAGIFKHSEVQKMVQIEKIFLPQMKSKLRKQKIEEWNRAVSIAAQ